MNTVQGLIARNSETSRNSAFSMQTESVPIETAVTLTDLILGKKVIIIGGHVIWRNKMKARYPGVTFIDGQIASLDLSIFNNASFILLNTANISHKVYNKVVDHLRDKKLRFPYLGRSNNQERLEAEVVPIQWRRKTICRARHQ
jgi:hypothetical protein